MGGWASLRLWHDDAVTDYMVTMVWDYGGLPDGLRDIPEVWLADSNGSLVTGLPVSARTPLLAYGDAVEQVRKCVPELEGEPVAICVEVTSATPHFSLAHYGK